MRLLWRLSREAVRYKNLYAVAILATLALTGVNLAVPRALSAMTGLVERGIDERGLAAVGWLTAGLILLYLLRVAFRFMSNYLAHQAACGPKPMISSNGCTWGIFMTSRRAI